MKKSFLLLCLLLMLFPAWSVSAQDDSPYSISLSRDFGYGNGADIQGQMTLSIRGDEDQVAKAVFLMDGSLIAEVTSAPYKYSFNTDQFTVGSHQLSATVDTVDGKTYNTRTLTYRIVASSEVGESMKRILIPIGIISLLGMLAPVLLQNASSKKRQQNPEEPVNYGYSGGAICPKCGHPFPLSLLSPHIGMLKFERCPSCKKWSMVSRANPQDLHAAELEEARKFGKVTDVKAEAKTKAEEDASIDDSRYIDGM